MIVSLREGKKQREKITYDLTFLWDSGATNRMIKRRHTKPSKQNMHSNKLEYITAAGPYYMIHDVKVSFCIPEFSIRKIKSHQFYVDNNEGESGIGYYIIIGCDLMLQLRLSDYFNLQVLQWYEVTVPMKKPEVC